MLQQNKFNKNTSYLKKININILQKNKQVTKTEQSYCYICIVNLII